MPEPLTIKNVRVFDGAEICADQATVTIDQDGLIGIDSHADKRLPVVDGTGMTLFPGLWDTHVHLRDHDTSVKLLQDMAKCGITMAIDCGRLEKDVYDHINSRQDLPSILMAGNFATSTGSLHSKFIMANAESIVDTDDQAVNFVAQQVSKGAHCIKLVADVPGPSQRILDSLSKEAAANGKQTIVHAAIKVAYDMALKTEPAVSFITHVPQDAPIESEDAKKMVGQTVAIPTLVMSETMCAAGFRPQYRFTHALDSVKELYQHGVRILVGTDSNLSKIAPVEHGKALFREMELLAEAGLQPIEIMRAATQYSAMSFGIQGGVIAAGAPADMVMVEGDPTVDLGAMRNVRKVWKGGRDLLCIVRVPSIVNGVYKVA